MEEMQRKTEWNVKIRRGQEVEDELREEERKIQEM